MKRLRIAIGEEWIEVDDEEDIKRWEECVKRSGSSWSYCRELEYSGKKYRSTRFVNCDQVESWVIIDEVRENDSSEGA